MSYAEGKIYIPQQDFWAFVQQYNPCKGGETVYGIPYITEFDICIKFAYNSDCNPMDQSTPPEFMKEWEKLKEINQ